MGDYFGLSLVNLVFLYFTISGRRLPITGHLLGNLEKIGFIFFGVCRVIFDDNIKNGGFQEVGTTPPIEKALVN